MPDSDAERLSLSLDAARLGHWSWDAPTDAVTLSRRAAEIFDVLPDAHFTWAGLRGLLHPDDRERAREAADRAIAAGTDFVVESRVGSGPALRWVSACGRPRYDPEHRLLGMLGVVQDVTGQVRDREALETQRQLLAEQAESLATIIRMGQVLSAEPDLESLVQSLTDAATELTGAEFGAFFYNVLDGRSGTYTLYALSGVDRAQFADFPMPRATSLFGPTFRGEGVIRLDDARADPRFGHNPPYQGMPPGHLPVCSYLAVPVTSRSGEVIGGLFFGHSQRARFDERAEHLAVGLAGQAAIAIDNARLFESVRHARQLAEEANRLKDEFLATLSHELRTPLNAVLGWARLLRTARVDERRLTKGIDVIERNARAQQEIIEDLLDVSRIVSGRLRLDVGRVALAPLIEAAVESLRPTAQAKGIQVSVVLSPSPGLVLGDAGRLQQIVWNLLSNALKFSPPGAQVRITLDRLDSDVTLTVADTGRGIAPEFLPHVFDRFRQGDAGTTRVSGGLGLGLAIVRHLVEIHGGTVTADSAGEGRGASFTIHLPLSIGLEATEANQPPPSVPAIDLPHERLLDGVRVLVVDDEPDTPELLREVLEDCGALVRTATSAAEGWAVLRQWAPDVILSDIGMPAADGYGFIARIRAEGNRTPAAALTAHARSTDRLRALSAGFQAHVPKPAEPSELIALVANLASLGRHAQRSAGV